ncbi:hypothetical protein IWQ57_005507, partial [Coemansia nantahalensis]
RLPGAHRRGPARRQRAGAAPGRRVRRRRDGAVWRRRVRRLCRGHCAAGAAGGHCAPRRARGRQCVCHREYAVGGGQGAAVLRAQDRRPARRAADVVPRPAHQQRRGRGAVRVRVPRQRHPRAARRAAAPGRHGRHRPPRQGRRRAAGRARCPARPRPGPGCPHEGLPVGPRQLRPCLPVGHHPARAPAGAAVQGPAV